MRSRGQGSEGLGPILFESRPQPSAHPAEPGAVYTTKTVHGIEADPNYFRTGNAARQFVQIDGYVVRRLRNLRVQRKGRNLKPGEARQWTRECFENLGLVRLRGTIRYPEQPFWKEAA